MDARDHLQVIKMWQIRNTNACGHVRLFSYDYDSLNINYHTRKYHLRVKILFTDKMMLVYLLELSAPLSLPSLNY